MPFVTSSPHQPEHHLNSCAGRSSTPSGSSSSTGHNAPDLLAGPSVRVVLRDETTGATTLIRNIPHATLSRFSNYARTHLPLPSTATSPTLDTSNGSSPTPPLVLPLPSHRATLPALALTLDWMTAQAARLSPPNPVRHARPFSAAPGPDIFVRALELLRAAFLLHVPRFVSAQLAGQILAEAESRPLDARELSALWCRVEGFKMLKESVVGAVGGFWAEGREMDVDALESLLEKDLRLWKMMDGAVRKARGEED